MSLNQATTCDTPFGAYYKVFVVGVLLVHRRKRCQPLSFDQPHQPNPPAVVLNHAGRDSFRDVTNAIMECPRQ